MNTRRWIWSFAAACSLALSAAGCAVVAEPAPPATPITSHREVYKTIGDVELTIDLIVPDGHTTADRRPAIVFFFGGGWTSGTVEQFRPQAEYLAQRGVVAALADYRVRSRHKTSPFACVADGKAAVRWLRVHSERLGIHPQRVAAGGGSAGGHVAAAAGVIEGLEDDGVDATVSSKPDALVLFNPVFDNGPGGWGHNRVKKRWREISPMHNIRAGAPPTTVFLGSKDKLIPVATAYAYQERMEAVGARCDVHIYDGQGHGFFNKSRSAASFDSTVAEADRFLVSLGWLQRPLTRLAELRWPATPRLASSRQLQAKEIGEDELRSEVLTVTNMLPEIESLAAFTRLRQLCVSPGVRQWGTYISKGEASEVARLARAADAPSLRRLRLRSSPTRPRDLATLAALPELEVLELAGLFAGDLAALRDLAQRGEDIAFGAFDAAMAEAVAAHSQAKTLVVESMPVSAAALRALAPAELDTLAIAARTPDGLAALSALQTLRQLSIGYASAPGGWRAAFSGSYTPQKASRGTYSPSLTKDLLASLAALPELEALTLRSCLLSDAVLDGLPRQLRQLDLYDCFGVTARLVDVVAEMPNLRELGMPLQVRADARGRRAAAATARIPTQGSDLHTRRLASADAAAIVRSRMWRRLRLDGTLTQELADALRGQAELVELRLTIDAASAPLGFVASLPALTRVVFEDMEVSKAVIAPLKACKPLQEVAFDNCLYSLSETFDHGLPARVRVRSFTRRFQ